jgi:hypothetical protein
MAIRFDLIGIVAADLAASLAFYRELGLDIPPEADTEPHVEVALPGGLRLAWDTAELVANLDPRSAATTPRRSTPPTNAWWRPDITGT